MPESTKTSSSIVISKLHPGFGAEVNGLNLTRPDAQSVATIHRLMDEHAVLLLRGQRLSEAQQIRLGEALGTIEARPATVGEGARRLQDARTNDISNLDGEGRLLAAGSDRRLFNLGNRLWHTDSSFKATPAKYSLLYGRSVPQGVGDTEFADMRAAWDALPAPQQESLRDRVALHSLLYSRALLGFSGFSDEERERYAPVRQRLVRRHPGSGRLSLYLASHIGEIDSMPRPEAMILVRDLIEFATQPRFVYRHRWSDHDLIIWDNRCTMHRATAFDDRKLVRDMRRVTVSDSAPSLEQPL